MNTETKTQYCFICKRDTDHKVKQLKSGHEYTCPVCKSSKFIPDNIKPEYIACIRCNDNGCPACDANRKNSKYNPEPY